MNKKYTLVIVSTSRKESRSSACPNTVRQERRSRFLPERLKSLLRFRDLLIVCILILAFQACSNPPTAPTSTTSPATPTPTQTPTPTATVVPSPTPIPFTWKQISNGQEIARDTITAIAIDPKDPDVLYVGTGHAGIYKSMDGGQSWKPVLRGLEAANVTSLVIDKLDSQILYAGIGTLGLFTSTDGGGNWIKTRENTSSDSPVHVYQSPGNSNVYYYQEDRSIYYKNNGKEWTKLSMPDCFGAINESAFTIHPQNDQILVSTCKDGLYRSENGGKDWKLSVEWSARYSLDNGIKDVRQVFATSLLIEELPNGAETFYLASDVRNDDLSAGQVGDPYWWSVASWCTKDSLVLNPKGGGYVFCNDQIFSFASMGTSKRALTNPNIGPIETIMVSPHDSNIIYAGGNGLARSADGGMTWTTLNNGLGAEFARLIKPDLEADVFYLWTGSVCTSKMADYTGAYRSLDRGQTWESIDKIGCSFAVSADGKTVFMAGEFHPNAKGYYIQGTWRWVGAEYFNEQIFRSNDYGKSWTAIPQRGNIFASPVISGRIYSFSIDDKNKSSISDDNGNTWQAINPGDLQTRDGAELYFSNDGNQMYACANSELYQSADSGASWKWLASGIVSEMVIHPQNTEKTLLTILDGNLQYLDLHGKSKPTDTPRFASPVINTLALDPNHPNTVYAGTDGGAYISFDFGQTWNQINDGLHDTTVVYSIVVDSESNIYAATPNGIFKLEGR